MDPIYVTGHRNPDTDSIVSAMAYAALRNALGDREYRAARLGHVSDETQLVLDRFGFPAPVWIKTMRTQVRDLDYDTPPALSSGVTISRAWAALSTDTSIAALPITNEDGTLFGMLSSGDIAASDMQSIEHPHIDAVPLFNVLSVLEGRILNEAGDLVDSISGDVCIALPQSCDNLLFSGSGSIIVCGHQPDMVRRAIEQHARCVIVCQAELDEQLRNAPTDTVIISTPFDAYRAVRLLYQSLPISRICRTKDLECFHLDDFVDDVREGMLKSRYRCYPILDENDRVVGTLSRYHLIRPKRKRVVLVDHNEAAQSVPGLDQAEILEIIDHHRIGGLETMNPVYFRNQPLGCTATIVYQLYREQNATIDKQIAGLLCSAILSDTLILRSPTCTETDKKAAYALAEIAGIDPEKYAEEMFAAGSNLSSRTPEEIFYQDFKKFVVDEVSFGVGQINSMTQKDLDDVRARLIPYMEKALTSHAIPMLFFMLTNIPQGTTELLCAGNGAQELARKAFHLSGDEDAIILKNTVSRKKQLIPALMQAIQQG